MIIASRSFLHYTSFLMLKSPSHGLSLTRSMRLLFFRDIEDSSSYAINQPSDRSVLEFLLLLSITFLEWRSSLEGSMAFNLCLLNSLKRVAFDKERSVVVASCGHAQWILIRHLHSKKANSVASFCICWGSFAFYFYLFLRLSFRNQEEGQKLSRNEEELIISQYYSKKCPKSSLTPQFFLF